MQEFWLEDDEPAAIAAAVVGLQAGAPVVFPTDTVYGLLASLDHPEGYTAIYDIKRRLRSQPLAVLVAGNCPLTSAALLLLAQTPELAADFQAGKLTIVADPHWFPSCPEFAAIQQRQPGTIGIRHPNHPPLQQLLQRARGVVWATSANPTGTGTGGTAELRAWLEKADIRPGLAVYSKNYTCKPASSVVTLQNGHWTYLRK